MTGSDDDWTRLAPPSADSGDTGIDEAKRQLALSFARTFGHPDGAVVLAHLRSLTRDRVLGPETPAAVLRHVEGQRALVAYMERLIVRGRT